MKSENVMRDLKRVARADKAEFLPRFFKCGQREYGEGDVFLGVVVPEQRKIAKKYAMLELSEIKKLLESKFHEVRLTGLLILVEQFTRLDSRRLLVDVRREKTDEKSRKAIFGFYLKNTKRINNWDFVDLTAPRIVGEYLLNKDRNILYHLSKSKNLWERRIAVLATLMFIRNNQFEDSLKIAKKLLKDKHDLIHKAVGWMLREIGKRDIKEEEKFLKKYSRIMPRTMLRYAIEKFPNRRRRYYLGM
jgi:3-methyladenine DNA glycosylase AlkD